MSNPSKIDSLPFVTLTPEFAQNTQWIVGPDGVGRNFLAGRSGIIWPEGVARSVDLVAQLAGAIHELHARLKMIEESCIQVGERNVSVRELLEGNIKLAYALGANH